MQTTRTQTKRMFIPYAALLCGALIVAACTAGNTAGSATGKTTAQAPTATTIPPTATPKPKPDAVPQITQAFCASILSVDAANQLMGPSTPATRIDAENAQTGGSCNYDYGQNQFPDLLIFFETWNGPNPIPQSQLNAVASEAVAKVASSGGKVTTLTMVSGVGDQAAFVAASGSSQGVEGFVDLFYVLDGKVFFDCTVINIGSPPPDATAMSKLQQCAQRVVSAL